MRQFKSLTLSLLVFSLFTFVACQPASSAGTGTSAPTACSGKGKLVGAICECDPGFAHPRGIETQCVALAANPTDGGDGGSQQTDAGTPVADDAGIDAGILSVNFQPQEEEAEYFSPHGGGQVWYFYGESGREQLIFINDSRFGGQSVTGEHALRAEDENYASCGFCLIYQRECSNSRCKESYMPKNAAGKLLTLRDLGTQAGTRFGFSLPDLMFQQVKLTEEDSTVVPDGKMLELKGADYSAEILPPECGGHGHLHGTVCHCDDGYKNDPQDEGNCIPE